MARVGEQAAAPLRSSLPVRVWRSVRSASVREPTMSLGLAVLAVLVLISLVGPILSSADPSKINMDARLQAPSATHWFGADEFGRDVFSRTILGGRISLFVGRDRRAAHDDSRRGLRFGRRLLPAC